jgi:hypothetical protein
MESTVQRFELTDLTKIPELTVPQLCEIWNWQGDKSVLPHKVNILLETIIYYIF